MARAKKSFDKDVMYKKIMPTALKVEQEFAEQNSEKKINVAEQIDSEKELERAATQNGTALFQNKEIKWINDNSGESILYNVTERLVMNRLEIALKKMNCCRCDRCKKDIIALALNGLKPHYSVSTGEELENLIAKDERLGLEVTSAILKAILSVRKHPRH